MNQTFGLGTRLRQLLAVLDSDVEKAYLNAGLEFRPRFYPYFCLLLGHGEMTVGQFADKLKFTQPAVTQSLNVMLKSGLIERIASKDKRERRFILSAKARTMLPALQAIWNAVASAAEAFEQAMPVPLRSTVDAALSQLAQEPFGVLIERELTR